MSSFALLFTFDSDAIHTNSFTLSYNFPTNLYLANRHKLAVMSKFSSYTCVELYEQEERKAENREKEEKATTRIAALLLAWTTQHRSHFYDCCIQMRTSRSGQSGPVKFKSYDWPSKNSLNCLPKKDDFPKLIPIVKHRGEAVLRGHLRRKLRTFLKRKPNHTENQG